MQTNINFVVVFFLLASLLGSAGFLPTALQGQTIRPNTQKEIRVFDPANPTNGNIGIRAATGTSGYTMVLPATTPGPNQVLGVSSINAGVASLNWTTLLTTSIGTGASGQVAYWTSTSAQSGSNNLFWNAASARLGIGTNLPSGKLSIEESTNNDLEVTATARGANNRSAQITFGVRNTNSNPVGGSIGSDGKKDGGLILNGNTGSFATSPTQVYLSSSGELYVNPTFNAGGILTDNGNFRLQVIGDIYATSARFATVLNGAYSNPLNLTSDGTLTTSTSDQRLKKNIETIPQALEKVLSLRGVTFNWKDSSMPRRMMGMIAQEVKRVVPELVFQNERDGYYGINYGETTGLLIEAIKEQQKMIQEQTKVVAKQGQEILLLIKEVNQLKQQLKLKS
jgi:hypothetical protein